MKVISLMPSCGQQCHIYHWCTSTWTVVLSMRGCRLPPHSSCEEDRLGQIRNKSHDLPTMVHYKCTDPGRRFTTAENTLQTKRLHFIIRLDTVVNDVCRHPAVYLVTNLMYLRFGISSCQNCNLVRNCYNNIIKSASCIHFKIRSTVRILNLMPRVSSLLSTMFFTHWPLEITNVQIKGFLHLSLRKC